MRFVEFLERRPPPSLESLQLPAAEDQKVDDKTLEALRTMQSKRRIEREIYKKKKKKGGKRHK